jgi:hypothetical protein
MPNPNVGPPTPPSALNGIPKAVVRALDPGEVFRSALDMRRNPGAYGASIALGVLESYFEAAKREQRRIEKARAKRVTRSTPRSSLFDEVHFYLICWTRIAKLARFIADHTRFRRTGHVLRRYHAELKQRVDARDHLEHFEERLPGGPKRHTLAVQWDLLNMAGHFLTYGGRKVDVGADSWQLLRAIVSEFRSALLFDSVESLATTDSRLLASFIRRAHSRVHIDPLLRRTHRLLDSSEPHETDRG